MPDSPKNILLIVVDQWRGDCLGRYENSWVKTPRLDALAALSAAKSPAPHHESPPLEKPPGAAPEKTAFPPCSSRSRRVMGAGGRPQAGPNTPQGQSRDTSREGAAVAVGGVSAAVPAAA